MRRKTRKIFRREHEDNPEKALDGTELTGRFAYNQILHGKSKSTVFYFQKSRKRESSFKEY